MIAKAIDILAGTGGLAEYARIHEERLIRLDSVKAPVHSESGVSTSA